MSKLKCKCGHIILDQTDNLSYKTHTFPDSEVDDLINILTHGIDGLITAITEGTRNKWIKNHLQSQSYANDLSNSSLIHDLLLRKMVSSSGHMYKCENCKRLLVQEEKINKYISYLPEPDDAF